MDRENEHRLNQSLTNDLFQNIETFSEIFHAQTNQDFVKREFCACGFPVCLIYLEGMTGGKLINDNVLRPLMACTPTHYIGESERAHYLSTAVVNISQTKICENIRELCHSIIDGNSLLLIDGCHHGLLLETRQYEKRSVERTQNESVLVGAQNGFVENLRSNITQIRLIVRTPALVTQMHDVGNQIPTKVALIYIDGVAHENVLQEVRLRLNHLNVDAVPDCGTLQQLIEDSNLQMLPQMLQTERPDRTADALLNGQVAIIVDNSPYALIAPITFYHLFHSADDQYMRWQYATFTRVMRILGAFLSLYLPGLYIALTLHHTHLIPLALLTSIAETRSKVPFPVLIEVLIMELSFFMINEAGTRMPSQIGPALGIVGALILGQSAVAASIISPVLIIIVALTGLGNYAVPVYSVALAFEMLRLGMVISGATLGFFGIVLTTFLYLCAFCTARSFGILMASPITPYRKHNPDIFVHLPMSMQKRLLFTAKRDSWLKRTASDKPMRGWKEAKR